MLRQLSAALGAQLAGVDVVSSLSAAQPASASASAPLCACDVSGWSASHSKFADSILCAAPRDDKRASSQCIQHVSAIPLRAAVVPLPGSPRDDKNNDDNNINKCNDNDTNNININIRQHTQRRQAKSRCQRLGPQDLPGDGGSESIKASRCRAMTRSSFSPPPTSPGPPQSSCGPPSHTKKNGNARTNNRNKN